MVNDDSGSILLWTIGVLLVMTSTFLALTSVITITSQQRELQYLADSAALAATSKIETTLFSETGVVSDISLDTVAARAIALEVIQKSDVSATLESISFEGVEVSVNIASPWHDVTGSFTRTLRASSTATFTAEGL